MNASEFLEQKVDNLINYLQSIPNVRKNSEAMQKLPSFRDIPWTISFCKQIGDSEIWKTDKQNVLSQLICDCNMKMNDFTEQERAKFLAYLECFVDVVQKYLI